MYTTAFLIALITIIVEALKRALKLDKGFIPLISLAIGVGVAFLAQNGFELTIRETILLGIFMGLSSAGLFSGLKSAAYVVEKLSKNSEKK